MFLEKDGFEDHYEGTYSRHLMKILLNQFSDIESVGLIERQVDIYSGKSIYEFDDRDLNCQIE